MWISLCLVALFLLAAPEANPITTETTSTGTTSTGVLTTHSTAGGKLLETAAETVTTTGTSAPGTTDRTATTVSPSLLKEDLAATQRLRGRVILANTRVEGSDEWGVDAKQAEAACNRIARYQSEGGELGTSMLSEFLHRFFSDRSGKERRRAERPMEGHLLSIGSSYEVMALSRLLTPLPDGAYWTGGKLTRYRVNKMRQPITSDHVILTWTDGRVGRPSILGLTRKDEQELKEGYTYCLALNLKEATWQARDCSDRLPYACLITPHHTKFSNKVTPAVGSIESAENSESKATTELPESIESEEITDSAENTQAKTNTRNKIPSDKKTEKRTTQFAEALLFGGMSTTKPTGPTTAATGAHLGTTGKVLDAAMYETTKMPTTGRVLGSVMHGTTGMPTTAKVLDASMHETTEHVTTGRVLGGMMETTTTSSKI
ncbi:hypothetical protein FGIG_03460 [Fasciola gigantica]|uniref:C-type lectin domain-containing protein n=1 Tax=Fasciola gigantica TaxID=46835 RepID=A0A504YMB3_FASGI|nr:hypothetical protein FGIG_03460 [Fasciola gigantica]